MTVRMTSCAELAADLKEVEEIQRLYWQLEKSVTPTSQLLPWFPGPAKKRKERVTKALFTKLYDYVELRKNAAVPSSDTIDVLLGDGVPSTEIVEVSRFQYIKSTTEEITTFIVHAWYLFRGSGKYWTYLFVSSIFFFESLTLKLISLYK
jgi:hypothetical protein